MARSRDNQTFVESGITLFGSQDVFWFVKPDFLFFCFIVLLHKKLSFLSRCRGGLRGRCGGHHGQHPGAMFDHALHMPGLVVGRVGLNHPPDDFQPTLAQAAQRLGVALSLDSFLGVIGLSPGALLTAGVSP